MNASVNRVPAVDAARILIVEDEALVAEDLTEQLTSLGHSVVASVPTGEEAIEAAARCRPDLVLMDVHLAGELSGTRAAAEISRRHELPVVFLTAHAGSQIIQEAREAVPYGYILKPFDMRELAINIRMALVRHRLEREREELIAELVSAYASVRQLSGLLPICAGCRRVRDDRGYWESVEEYIQKNADVRFSHGLCPDCLARLYPEQQDNPGNSEHVDT